MTDRPRLFVLDDEERICALVAEVAESHGYRVETAVHPADFQARVEAFRPDVVLLDIVMPELDGIEVVRWLVDRRVRARLVLVTGYDPLYARAARQLAEAHLGTSVPVLTKPIAVRALRAALVAPEAPSGG